MIEEFLECIYFTEAFTYYVYQNDSSDYILYRIDYNGKNKTEICTFKEPVLSFAVYQNKILIVLLDENKEKALLGEMDLSGKNLKIFDNINPCITTIKYYKARIYVNNGWLYYINEENENLCRVNLIDYNVEQVMNKKIGNINFTSKYLLYSNENSLYRMNTSGSSKLIRTIEAMGGDYKDVIAGMITQNEMLFFSYYSDYLITRIEMIDIDGKVLKKFKTTYYDK